MAHLVFLLHGMGHFGPQWSAPVRTRLQQIPQTWGYPALRDGELLRTLQFVQIDYDPVFEAWRRQWRTDAATAAAAAQGAGMARGLARALLKAATAPTGQSFFQTHLLDVALFHGVPQVAQQVQQQVRRQILDRLAQAPQNQMPQWSVLAHSLGSAVAAETLHRMFTHGVDDHPPLADVFKPRVVAMVANTSRLLGGRRLPAHGSHLRPGPRPGADPWICRHYMDFRHALDPIAQVRPFHPPPPEWLPPGPPPGGRYTHVTLRAGDIRSVNVHALEHHLDHPDVHVPLLTALAQEPGAVTPEEHASALKRWRAGALHAATRRQAQAQLQALAADPQATLPRVLGRWLRYRREVAAPHPADGEG